MSAKAARAAIKAAYAADPDGMKVFPYGLANTACFDADGTDDNPPWAWEDRKYECPNMVSHLYGVYVRRGTPEFYAAALATYNFFANFKFQSQYSDSGSKKEAVRALKDQLLRDWP